MKATKILALATMAIGVTVAGASFADNQFGAGAACQVQLGSGGTAEYNGDGSITNGGSSSLYLICPIDRGAFGSAGTMAVKAFTQNNNGSSNVCCAAWHRNAGSSSFFASGSSCASTTGTYQPIDLTIPNHVGTFDYAYMQCIVPGVPAGGLHSGVVGYRGIEQ